MHYEKPKGGAGRKVLFALLLVLLFAVSGVVTFVLMGGHKGLPMFQKAPEAYTVSGQLKVLRLAPPEDADEAALREYFGAAVAFANENGVNTLLFEAKQGATVWWRDKSFPPVAGAAAQDTWRHTSDPLAILCERLAGENIQLWLEVDPYEGGAVPADSKSALAKLMAETGAGADSFDPADAQYQKLLAQSLGALPGRYPIAGIVFSGLEDAMTGGTAGEDFRHFLEQLHTALADTGRLPALGLAYDEAGTLPGTAYAKGLKDEGLLTYALPAVHTGGDTAARMRALSVLGDGLVLQEPKDDNGLVLFFAGQNPALSGILYGAWPADAEDMGHYAFLSASLATVDSPMPTGFEVPAMLTVNYPAQNAKIYTDQLYIMGSSDPALPLLLDGAEIPADNRAAGGSFGLAVDLTAGDNSFTFTQGDKAVTLNVTRATAAGGTAPTYPQDHTHEAKAGQVIKVVSQIASALSVPGDLSAISETLPVGATFVATGSTKIYRSGYTSWAYQMPSGDWVQAVNCQWLNGDGKSAFTGITVTADDEKRGEWLDFSGSGSPAAYISYDDATGALTLTFYDTALQLPDGLSSQYVEHAEVAAGENGSTVLTLQTRNLWGYNIEYGENTTRLFLKGKPTLSDDPAKPLTGIRVMLDPGHGDTDIGAPGIMGNIGPNEKHMNLAQAQAIAYRLEQLGATVLMTRTGDEFYELEERLAMQNEAKPDFFLAVHHNSVELDRDRSSTKGVEAYYYHPYIIPPSKDFAQNLVDRVSEESGRAKRKDAEWTYFYVTRSTVCPSVLFEYGFVVSPGEFEDIISEDSLYTVAFATVEALMETIPQ